jgi:hypothetical protein
MTTDGDRYTTLEHRLAAALQSSCWRLDVNRAPPRLVYDDGWTYAHAKYVTVHVGGLDVEVPDDFTTRRDVPSPNKIAFDRCVRRHLGDAMRAGWKLVRGPRRDGFGLHLEPPAGHEAERWAVNGCQVSLGSATVLVPSHFTHWFGDAVV